MKIQEKKFEKQNLRKKLGKIFGNKNSEAKNLRANLGDEFFKTNFGE